MGCLTCLVVAGSSLFDPRSITADRASAIRIDGILDEPVWSTAIAGEHFIQ